MDVELLTINDYDLDELDKNLWRIYEEDDPAKVYECFWDILFDSLKLSSIALWEKDYDGTMNVIGHRNIPGSISLMRLPKMDSAIGKAVMVAGKPLLFSDIQSSSKSDNSSHRLSSAELKELRKSGVHTVLILPCQYKHYYYSLMLCFPDIMFLSPEIIDKLSTLCNHLVKAFGLANDRFLNSALIQLGKLLSPAVQLEQRTVMNEAAEIIRRIIHAGGVSIFLLSENGKRIELAGVSPAIKGALPFKEVYYELKPGQGLTPEVALRREVLRCPNLKAKGATEELRARGYVWKNRWSEDLDYESHKTHPFLAVPLEIKDNTNNPLVGVIRASICENGNYFTIQHEEAFLEMAERLANFVNDVKTAQAQTTEAMHHIAHQFISPLNALVWHCYALRKGGLSEDREEIILESIDNLASLAMLYGMNFDLISRIWGGAPVNFKFRDIQVKPLLLELARNYQPLAGRRNVNINVAVDDEEGSVDSLKIQADRNAINQAFAIVIDNAVKYSVSGSTVYIHGNTTPDEVNIHVTNISSIPIKSEWCERIFRRGERTPEAEATEVPGTGTGLWLARKILSIHNGNVITEPSQEVRSGYKVHFTLQLKNTNSSWRLGEKNVEKLRNIL